MVQGGHTKLGCDSESKSQPAHSKQHLGGHLKDVREFFRKEGERVVQAGGRKGGPGRRGCSGRGLWLESDLHS